jgi:hypothetical protein
MSAIAFKKAQDEQNKHVYEIKAQIHAVGTRLKALMLNNKALETQLSKLQSESSEHSGRLHLAEHELSKSKCLVNNQKDKLAAAKDACSLEKQRFMTLRDQSIDDVEAQVFQICEKMGIDLERIAPSVVMGPMPPSSPSPSQSPPLAQDCFAEPEPENPRVTELKQKIREFR